MIRAGVIGYGYWGPNVARNFTSSGRFEVAVICERDPGQQRRAREAHPGAAVTADLDAILSDASIEAVAVVTPVATHHRLCLDALGAGEHVWVVRVLEAACESLENRGKPVEL